MHRVFGDVNKANHLAVDNYLIPSHTNGLLENNNINVSNNYVRIKNLKKISASNSLEKMIIRNPNSSNPTLRRCNSIIKTHDNDDYFSLPLDKTVSSNDKIIFNEKNNKLKLTIKQKAHSKPVNAVLVKIGGTHKQKIGAYSTEVDL